MTKDARIVTYPLGAKYSALSWEASYSYALNFKVKFPKLGVIYLCIGTLFD